MPTNNVPVDIWETKRAVITRLYKDEEWPLKQVIKMIQSREFRPSETQVRARLKKWKITKPSRKRYAGERRCPTNNEHKFRTTRFFEAAQEDGVSPSSPISAVRRQAEHECSVSKGTPNRSSISKPDLLKTAFIDNFSDPNSLPAVNGTPLVTPFISGSCATSGTVELSATPSLDLTLGLENGFSPSMGSCRWLQVASEPVGPTPSDRLQVGADENNTLGSLPVINMLQPDMDNTATTSDTCKTCEPYSTPITQGHLDLAPCKDTMPGIVQRNRRELLQDTATQPTRCGIKEPSPDLLWSSYLPPLSFFSPPTHDGQPLCLACQDFSRL